MFSSSCFKLSFQIFGLLYLLLKFSSYSSLIVPRKSLGENSIIPVSCLSLTLSLSLRMSSNLEQSSMKFDTVSGSPHLQKVESLFLGLHWYSFRWQYQVLNCEISLWADTFWTHCVLVDTIGVCIEINVFLYLLLPNSAATSAYKILWLPS